MSLNMFSEAELTQVGVNVLEDFNNCETTGRFIDDVKAMKIEVHLIKQQLARLTKGIRHQLKRLNDPYLMKFENHRNEFLDFSAFVQESLKKILISACGEITAEHHSESLLNSQVLVEPFITLKYADNSTEDVFVSKSIQQSWLSSTSQRELVRKVLLYAHDNDVVELRKFTLTGRAKVRVVDGEGDSEDIDIAGSQQSKLQLPARTVMMAQAAGARMYPPPAIVKNDPGLHQQAIDKLKKDTRTNITMTLNYFVGEFDENGRKIKKQRLVSKNAD